VALLADPRLSVSTATVLATGRKSRRRVAVWPAGRSRSAHAPLERAARADAEDVAAALELAWWAFREAADEDSGWTSPPPRPRLGLGS
jgi:hypothetical protein